MAAPTHTTRQTPGGRKLKDGHSTKVAIAADPDISFWEKGVKPAGWDGGAEIDQTTMHNDDFRTFAPRSLITRTAISVTAAYNPLVLTQLQAIINIETTITVHHPDGSQESDFGWVQKAEKAEHKGGTQPEMTVTIFLSNFDNVNNVEAGPFYTDVAGT